MRISDWSSDVCSSDLHEGSRMSKVIITCAVTGSVHTPSMSPYLPITPDEIVADAVAAAEAGAAMIHLHARDPKTGKPTPSPEIFGQFLSRIKQQKIEKASCRERVCQYV